MTFLRTRLIPTLVVAAIVGVAVFVFHREPEAAWLRVEAPSVIVAGEPFTATVTLLEPADGAFLDFDLHGQDAGKNPLRCVAAGTTQRVAGGMRAFTFTLVLRNRPDVARVHAVIYLSRTGQWSDAFRTARSESFAVARDASAAGSPRVGPLVVHDQRPDPEIVIANPVPLRAATTALWLAAAAVAAIATRRPSGGSGARLFAALCLALAVWEALAVGAWIEDHGRALVRAAGYYEDRAEFQKWATTAAVALVGCAAVFGLRRSRRRIPGLALGGVALYTAVAVAGMLSFHEIDRVLALSLGPIPLAGAARATAASLALVGAVRRVRAASASPARG